MRFDRDATPPSEEDVRAVIGRIHDPCSQAGPHPMTLVEMGLVRRVGVGPAGDVKVVLCVTSPGCLYYPQLAEAVTETVGELPGVRQVAVELDTSFTWTPDQMSGEARRRRDERLTGRARAVEVRPRQWRERADESSHG